MLQHATVQSFRCATAVQHHPPTISKCNKCEQGCECEQGSRPPPGGRLTDRLGRDPRSDDLGRDLTGNNCGSCASPVCGTMSRVKMWNERNVFRVLM
eukprot:5897386-Prymnesium_polylepis.1